MTAHKTRQGKLLLSRSCVVGEHGGLCEHYLRAISDPPAIACHCWCHAPTCHVWIDQAMLVEFCVEQDTQPSWLNEGQLDYLATLTRLNAIEDAKRRHPSNGGVAL